MREPVTTISLTVESLAGFASLADCAWAPNAAPIAKAITLVAAKACVLKVRFDMCPSPRVLRRGRSRGFPMVKRGLDWMGR